MPSSDDVGSRELAVAAAWERDGLYRRARRSSDGIFSCVIPAPNCTGPLHLGHALNLTLQDVCCRYWRIEGRHVYWSAALSHGGFSTQTVVERQLRQRAITPRELPAGALADELRAWADALTPKMFDEMRRCGASLDFSGGRRTDDELNHLAVTRLFVELHRRGFLYHAEGVVDYCPGCRTTIDAVDQVGTLPELRCKNCLSAIEKQASKQWFFAASRVRSQAAQLLREDRTRIVPSKYGVQVRLWLSQLPQAGQQEDVCVSRQLSCGNRLPVFECRCGETYVGVVKSARCPCGQAMQQSPDVMSLWMSDALWAFIANDVYLDEVEQARIDANSLCVTGADLTFYWIGAIALFAAALSRPLPFSCVLIHPLVCDANGSKMSKSIGNTLSPSDIVRRFGADCLRLTLLQGLNLDSPRLQFDSRALEGNHRLLEALRQASCCPLDEHDREEAELGEAACQALSDALERYDFTLVYQWARQLIRSLASGKLTRSSFARCLAALHPLCPFVTEELFQRTCPGSAMLARGAGPLAPDVACTRSLTTPQSAGERHVFIER